ncbi:UPF0182 family membrane protein [Asanoa iriomotensis]|uniref:UPF0182 family membrane protein n=1 Tax=Asanoa iriomotensis TaxID=234613 RepID=UPI001942D9D7|nr:UPF0182 family protein [Asanoa iriomotensis]
MVMRSSPLPRMSRRGRVTVGVLVGVFVLFTLLGWGVNAWTDWLWFDEVHYTKVFSTVLTTRLLLFLAVGAAMAVVIGGNLYLAYRLRPLLRPHSSEQQTLDRYRVALTPRIGLWVTIVSLVVGLFAGLSAQGRWDTWMLFRNAQTFGTKDPIFNIDVGFYVFQYPFYRYLLGVGFTAVVLAVIGSLAVHYIFGGVRLQGGGDRITNAARAHLTTLVAVFVLFKAIAYVLDRRALLLSYNEGAKVYGAGYADVNALLPAKEILGYISIVVAIAIILFSNAIIRNLVWPGVSLALLGISAVAIGGIYPSAVQSFEVNPSTLDKERPYIKNSIEATRAAFGINDVDIEPYAGVSQPPPASLATDTSVVPNIRLLDPQLLSETYTQLQQARGFYNFGEKLDIDRYAINGNTQDYVVGVREINYRGLTAQQSNWLNRHTIYTHGYGVVAAPANRVCNEQPYFVSGFLGEEGSDGCQSATEEIKTEQPRIYYGEQMEDGDYAVVGSRGEGSNAEFDRPTGSNEQYYTYEGAGGVPIGSFTRRLLYTVKMQETNFLLSEAVNDNSKLLYVRNPRDRVAKVAPFLKLDGDPYPAVVDGRVVWIVDGYTTASTYPNSERVNLQSATTDELTGTGTVAQVREEINYIRNSVKATVDAYDGTVKLYQWDEQDPVLKAWNKAFGGNLVVPKAEIPQELTDHFRYPADLFKVQRDLLARYHVSEPNEFFSGQDYWEVPNAPDDPDRGQKQPPYYLMTQMPGQAEPRFQLTSAVTPRGRQNLAAIISASYVDGQPKLEALELPDQSVVSGPVQVHQQMTNATDVRGQLSVLAADGKAAVQYGNLLSLPFDNGMLYVEPVYVKSNQQNAYPLLQRVLLSYGDGSNAVLASSLQQGIKDLVAKGDAQRQAAGQPPAPPTQPNPPPTTGEQPPAAMSPELAQAAQRVSDAIDEVKAAQESGDFNRYGKALADLDAAADAFKAAQQAANNRPASTSPTPTPTAPASPAGTPPPTPQG